MILAIDQSYSGTGVAYISADGQVQSALIKTSPNFSWEERMDYIIGILDSYFDMSALDSIDNPSPIEHVVIESYAFASTNSQIFQLGELGGVLKYHFHSKGVDVVTMLIAHPKMFMAGNGQATKSQVMNGLYGRFGIRERDDNVADAISIGLTYRYYLMWKSGTWKANGYLGTLMVKVDSYLNGKQPESKPKRKSVESCKRTALQIRPENF